MKHLKIIKTLILILISFCVWSQSEKEDLIVGFSIKIQSEIMDQENTLLVSLPPDYENSNEDYPVILFLDGMGNYQHTFGAVRKLAKDKGMEQSIVIGIQTSDRNRDFLPMKPGSPEEAGGADTFLEFINEELFSLVDKNYRTQTNRTLIGHSFGGLFVLHTLMTKPESFNCYLAISPSCWLNNGKLNKQAKEFFSKEMDLSNTSLFFTVANEGLDMGVNEYATILKDSSTNLNWHFEHYEEESHSTTPYLSTWNGFRFFYKDWEKTAQKN